MLSVVIIRRVLRSVMVAAIIVTAVLVNRRNKRLPCYMNISPL